GATLPRYHDDGIAIAETRFAADLVIPQHEHLNPFFCFVLNGRGTRSWPARAGADRPMALTLFPAGVPHANRWYGGGGEALHVEFSPLWLERLGGHAGELRTPSDFADGAPVSLMRRLVAECREPDTATPLAVEGLVLELVAACANASMKAWRWTRSPPPAMSPPTTWRANSASASAAAWANTCASCGWNSPAGNWPPGANRWRASRRPPASPTRAISRGCSAAPWARRRRPIAPSSRRIAAVPGIDAGVQDRRAAPA